MATLLEKAKASYRKRISKETTADELELAWAYLSGEIGVSALEHALEYKKGSATRAYAFVNRVLRDAVRSGDVVLAKPKKK